MAVIPEVAQPDRRVRCLFRFKHFLFFILFYFFLLNSRFLNVTQFPVFSVK
jgi:hypothetical protein